MPRGNRYFVPGHVYHLTHRCHNRQFLLKFARDRETYRQKLREFAREFDVAILDYCLTCNHVHLMAESESPDQISCLMQRVAGQLAQSYNRRKDRHGAFWEDRFHSTMVEPGEHLARCMVYIALNMVRCGVVSHPREWPWCGYTEHMGVRKRNCVVDQEAVCRLLNGATPETFRRFYEERVAERIARDQIEREALWTQSIAVGSQPYVERISGCLTGRQKLNITPEGDSWVILESPPPYRTF